MPSFFKSLETFLSRSQLVFRYSDMGEGPEAFMPRPGPHPLAEGPRGTVPGIPVPGPGVYGDPDLMPGAGAGIPPG